jgi:hypothetical protein
MCDKFATVIQKGFEFMGSSKEGKRVLIGSLQDFSIGPIDKRTQLYPFKDPVYNRGSDWITYEYSDADILVTMKACISKLYVTMDVSYVCGVGIRHIHCYNYKEAIDIFRMLTSSYAKERAKTFSLCK